MESSPQDCEHQCDCALGNYCHHITGECLQCQNGFYGSNCLSLCGCNAAHTSLCSHTTGRCFCQDGWYGDRCELFCPHGYKDGRCLPKVRPPLAQPPLVIRTVISPPIGGHPAGRTDSVVRTRPGQTLVAGRPSVGLAPSRVQPATLPVSSPDHKLIMALPTANKPAIAQPSSLQPAILGSGMANMKPALPPATPSTPPTPPATPTPGIITLAFTIGQQEKVRGG